MLDMIIRFLFLLMKWNKKYNIISMKHPQDIIKKHILDSLNLLQYIKNFWIKFCQMDIKKQI